MQKQLSNYNYHISKSFSLMGDKYKLYGFKANYSLVK